MKERELTAGFVKGAKMLRWRGKNRGGEVKKQKDAGVGNKEGRKTERQEGGG